MNWLIIDNDLIKIDGLKYIESQPVVCPDVELFLNKLLKVQIDITHVNIYDLNIFGFMKIIWQLHELTEGENILTEIQIVGASRNAKKLWSCINSYLPEFVRDLIFFSY